jgi:hypothetical protein
MARGVSRGVACAATVAVVVAASGCGSTKVKTVVSTTTVTTTVTPTQPTTGTTTPTTTTSTAPANTDVPALSGSYQVSGASVAGSGLPNNPHDGITNPDSKWIGLTGSCASPTSCTVQLRRVLSDNTLETMTVTSNRPAGVYTGTPPGSDGEASCTGTSKKVPVTLGVIIRLGGLQTINGVQVATKLAGHIFGNYTCPGHSLTHVVDSYTGTRTGAASGT